MKSTTDPYHVVIMVETGLGRTSWLVYARSYCREVTCTIRDFHTAFQQVGAESIGKGNGRIHSTKRNNANSGRFHIDPALFGNQNISLSGLRG